MALVAVLRRENLFGSTVGELPSMIVREAVRAAIETYMAQRRWG